MDFHDTCIFTNQDTAVDFKMIYNLISQYSNHLRKISGVFTHNVYWDTLYKLCDCVDTMLWKHSFIISDSGLFSVTKYIQNIKTSKKNKQIYGGREVERYTPKEKDSVFSF